MVVLRALVYLHTLAMSSAPSSSASAYNGTAGRASVNAVSES
jgi:hypothetical protein